jgi:hypothetical protein
MSVVGLDEGARAIRGSHGRLPSDAADAPVLIAPGLDRDRYAATEVKELLLKLLT